MIEGHPVDEAEFDRWVTEQVAIVGSCYTAVFLAADGPVLDALPSRRVMVAK